MGCGDQLHEKTDKHGMWTHHSVDGWYLITSPEHYRTHVCHVKATRSEWMTDTMQLSHKNITNTTIEHANTVMHTVSACALALKGIVDCRYCRKNRSVKPRRLGPRGTATHATTCAGAKHHDKNHNVSGQRVAAISEGASSATSATSSKGASSGTSTAISERAIGRVSSSASRSSSSHKATIKTEDAGNISRLSNS